MALGEVYYHLPGIPNSDSLATDAFNSALASDSGFTPPIFHLAEIAIRAGDKRRAAFLINRFDEHDPSPLLAMELRLMFDCIDQGAGKFDWAQAAESNPREVLLAGKSLSVAGSKLGCADGAFLAVLRTRSAAWHWSAVLGHHAVLAATGNARALATFLDSIIAAGTAQQAMTLYLLDAAAGLAVADKARGIEAFGKQRWGPTYDGLRARPTTDWIQWMFGVWHATGGDSTTLRAVQHALDSAARSGGRPTQRLYADALAARVSLLARDTAGAITRLAALSYPVPPDSLDWELAPTLAPERALLSELLLARHRFAEAHAVATMLDHPGPLMCVVFLPRSLVVRYRAAVAAGRRDAANRYRQRLADLGRQDLIATLQ